jgi:hypothetical protein
VPAPVITSAATAPQPAPAAPEAGIPGDRDDDGVAIAHKKVISPITTNVAQPVNLDELLAKEGFSSDFNEKDENAAPPPPPPVITPNTPTPGAAASTNAALPTTPHPPGHVISPNGGSGVDPNSIAL